MVSARFLHFLSVLLFVTLRKSIGTTSYTSDGKWQKIANHDKTEQCLHYLCSPDGYAWKQNSSPSVLYNDVTGCDALIKKGIKKISFYGDSYMRHLFAAMLITLNGNYDAGSQTDSTVNNGNNPCRFQNQFEERDVGCRNRVNSIGKVCDNKVTLEPLLDSIFNHDRGPIYRQTDGTVVLWTLGNHPIEETVKPGRYGVNDAFANQQWFESDGFCPFLRDNKDKLTGVAGDSSIPYSLWWVSTHARLMATQPDEEPEYVKKFNVEMRDWADSGKCGNMNYIDVFNMTEKLINTNRKEAVKMTFDEVHWGLEVNLVKCQIILNALLG